MKQSGLGDNFYLSGYDLSGDVNAVDQLGGGPALLDVTSIKDFANERIGGLRDGDWQFTSFWNASSSTPVLDALPTADVVACYFRGTTLQNPAAAVNGKQVNYDPTRDASGNLTMKTEVQANGYGMEWGVMLTAGLRADTTATVGAYIDTGAGSNYGGQAYFQLVAFTGTSVTIDIQSCTSSGGSYATTGLTSSAMTAIGAQRVAVVNTTTINRYIEVVTTGTFTVATFAVVFVRNPVAGVVF